MNRQSLSRYFKLYYCGIGALIAILVFAAVLFLFVWKQSSFIRNLDLPVLVANCIGDGGGAHWSSSRVPVSEIESVTGLNTGLTVATVEREIHSPNLKAGASIETIGEKLLYEIRKSGADGFGDIVSQTWTDERGGARRYSIHYRAKLRRGEISIYWNEDRTKEPDDRFIYVSIIVVED